MTSAVQPTPGDIRNRWWYALGTILKPHPDCHHVPLHEGHTYTVIQEPHFAQVTDNDWTVRIKDLATQDEFDCLVTRLLRVTP